MNKAEHTYPQSISWFMTVRGILACACQAFDLVDEDDDKCMFLGIHHRFNFSEELGHKFSTLAEISAQERMGVKLHQLAGRIYLFQSY